MKTRYIVLMLGTVLFGSCIGNGPVEGELPEVETLPVEVAGSSTAVLRGSTKGGTADMLCRGVCFSSNEIFSFKDSPCVSTDAGEGEFAIKTYELIPKHKYGMKAFAVMRDGTIVYGKEMFFSTTDFSLPTVKANEVTEIYASEATLNGTIVDEGDYSVTSCGFVYTANATATLELGQETVISVLAKAEKADFSVTVGGLAVGTTYRVRAYAMTENGPGYSTEIKFSTPDVKPVVFAPIEVLENTYSSLKIKSGVVNPNGATIKSSGFCWSSDNKLPSVKNSSFKALGSDFTLSFEDARPGKVYYVRPYAETTEIGTSYGDVTRLKVITYDCDGGMIKVVPDNPVYIGWLGDYEQPSMPAKFSQAHDGNFLINMSVGRSSVPVPSEANLQPYCIAKYEVTNRWFCEFLNAYGSAVVKDGSWQGQAMFYDAYTDIHADGAKWVVDEEYLDCPATGITWYGAVTFCDFFGGYLPSEAQWEVAARGNVYSNDPARPMYMYSGSDDLNEIAIWANGVARSRCEKVGQLKPNQLGIYDMSGNAQEMTSSWWGNYQASYTESAPNANLQIVVRGGRAQRGVASTFQNNARDALAITAPVAYSNYIGFRFACNPDDED